MGGAVGIELCQEEVIPSDQMQSSCNLVYFIICQCCVMCNLCEVAVTKQL